MRIPLISKINPPRVRQWLSRPRLLSRLEQCRKYRLLLLSAGTGFGKTTLLSDFAHRADMNLAWYTLDESDRDPAVFCTYLLHSVRRVYPEFGRAFESLLEQNLKELHQESMISRLAEEFIGDLELLSQGDRANFRPTLLVLDDFQFAEGYGVNHFVQKLLWWLPDDFHVIIASRTQPQDLMLTKLLSKQMMSTLGPRDLAFSRAEVEQLLSELYHTTNSELAEALTAYSEGWITAIVLALSNLAEDTQSGWNTLNQNSPSATRTSEQLFNYLAQEVFQSQRPDLQNFLLRTSVMSTLSSAACDILMAIANPGHHGNPGEVLLKELQERNLFITILETEHQTLFQYHSLFRQFLLSKLAQSKELFQKCHLAAAPIQQQAGNYAEAVQHYVEAGAINQAAELLNEIVQPLYESGRMKLLSEMLDAIPAEEQSRLPHLLSVKARLLMEQGNHQAALRTYLEAEQVCLKEHLRDYAARAQAEQAQILARTGRHRESLDICAQVLKEQPLLSQTVEGKRALASSQLVSGTIAIEEGRYREAEAALKEAVEMFKALKDNFRLAVIDNHLGQLYFKEGRLLKSTIYYDRSLQFFVQVGNRSREAYCRTSLAINHYLKGNYKDAERQLIDTLNLTQDISDQYLRLFGLSYLANIYRNTERYAKADATYGQALELARESQVRKMELALLSDQSFNFILDDKKEQARLHIQLSIEMADEYALPERAAFSYRAASWLEYQNRSFKRALSLAQKAFEMFTASRLKPEEAQTRLLLATIQLAMGEPRRAMTELTQCMDLVQSLGFEPFLPFELRWANGLFEYAARKKVNFSVEEFLRGKGFYGNHNLLSPTLSLKPEQAKTEGVEALARAEQEYEQEEESESAPIQLTERLAKAQQRKSLLAAATSDDSTSPASGTGQYHLRVFALDGGRVWLGDIEITQWRNTRAREALFFLLDRKNCTRDQLLEELWPDAEDFDKAPHVLHNTLSLLRKAISPVELKLSAGRYYLVGNVWYDVDEFVREVKASTATREFNAERLSRALVHYKRDFLEQTYSDWSTERQQELQQLYLRSLEKLARYYGDELHRYHDALHLWRQLLSKDQYNEDAHRSAIDCLLKLGNKPEARRQSDRCLKALEELDLRPSPQTAQLLQNLA